MRRAGSKSVSIGSSSASSPSYSAWRPSARMPITSLRRSGVFSTPAELRTIRRVLMSCVRLVRNDVGTLLVVASETNADGESVCTPYEMSSVPSWRASLMAFTKRVRLHHDIVVRRRSRWPATLVKSTEMTVAPGVAPPRGTAHEVVGGSTRR